MRLAPARPATSATASNLARASGKMRLDAGGAAIGHQEIAGLSARAGDAVGEGQRDQGAGREIAGLGAFVERPGGVAQCRYQALRQPARVFRARPRFPRPAVEAVAEVEANRRQARVR